MFLVILVSRSSFLQGLVACVKKINLQNWLCNLKSRKRNYKFSKIFCHVPSTEDLIKISDFIVLSVAMHIFTAGPTLA